MWEKYTLLMISVPVVLPTFSRESFQDHSLNSDFICALQVKAGHLPVNSMSIVAVQEAFCERQFGIEERALH